MKVLFLESHPMWIHGLPNGFRDAGHTVKISGALTYSKLKALLRDFRPQLIISLGWTSEHDPSKQLLVRKLVGASGIPHVYWATEDPTHHETFTLPYVRRVKPSFVFTICRRMVKEYEQLGIKAAHLDFGYHRKVHRNGKPRQVYRSKLALVANGYSRILNKYPDHYRIRSLSTLIRPLVKNNIRVDIWGKQWEKPLPAIGATVPKSWQHGYVNYTNAHKIYNSADIVIGLQNQLTQVTQRTYEILGSGGFLLTNDTPEIRRLFQPGKHLVVSASESDTLRLVRYYLKNPKERNRIRLAGRKAAFKHSYKWRAIQLITTLKSRGILR
ncbi:glycosyltransferase [Paenibacillus sp. NEAU-GSW1]|uniref:CgeB family protein n=1 Tax=Paenibacillus sp. NEAU-GSW1 TaxID=2682486 RepID=UPI0012E14892|nr:glycosyltransferase [Paenibacillus sp. NEAU-GSW1]MUT67086.1 glycosyltransferase [Paenibacillus sp. NEAU-GSW1]